MIDPELYTNPVEWFWQRASTGGAVVLGAIAGVLLLAGSPVFVPLGIVYRWWEERQRRRAAPPTAPEPPCAACGASDHVMHRTPDGTCTYASCSASVRGGEIPTPPPLLAPVCLVCGDEGHAAESTLGAPGQVFRRCPMGRPSPD